MLIINKPFLNQKQIDRLEDLCDEDGFVRRVNNLARDIHDMLSVDNKERTGINIPLLSSDARKNSSKPYKAKTEINQLIKTLESISPDVMLHIAQNSKTHKYYFEVYGEFIKALKKPYKNKRKTHYPERDWLVLSLYEIIGDYDIKISTYENSELVNIVRVICDSSIKYDNKNFSPTEIARHIKDISEGKRPKI